MSWDEKHSYAKGNTVFEFLKQCSCCITVMIKIVSVWLWILLQLEFSHFWSNLLPRPGDVLSWSHIWIIIHACLFSLLKINLYQVYVSTWIRCIYLNWQWQTQLYASIYFFFSNKGPFPFQWWSLESFSMYQDTGFKINHSTNFFIWDLCTCEQCGPWASSIWL